MQEDGAFGLFFSVPVAVPQPEDVVTRGGSLAPGGELSNGTIQLILSKVSTKLNLLEREIVELAGKNLALEKQVSSLISKNQSLEEQVSSVLEYTSNVHEKVTRLERQGSLPTPPVVTPEREGVFHTSFSVSPSSTSCSRSLLFHSPERGGADKADTGICTTAAAAAAATAAAAPAPTTTASSCPPKIVYSMTDLHQIRSKYVDGPVSKRRIPSPLLLDAIKTKESYKNITRVQPPPLHRGPSSSSPSSPATSSASSARNSTPVRSKDFRSISRDSPPTVQASVPPAPPVVAPVVPVTPPPRTSVTTVEQVGEFTVCISGGSPPPIFL